MNRRQLIQSALATLHIPEIESCELVEKNTNPFIAVLTAPGPISDESAKILKECIDKELTNDSSPWKGVKLFVFGDGLTIQFFDVNGRLLNKPVVESFNVLMRALVEARAVLCEP